MRLQRMKCNLLGDITSKFISHHPCVSTFERVHCCFAGDRHVSLVSAFLALFVVRVYALLEMSYGVGLPLFTTYIDNPATVQFATNFNWTLKSVHFQTSIEFILSRWKCTLCSCDILWSLCVCIVNSPPVIIIPRFVAFSKPDVEKLFSVFVAEKWNVRILISVWDRMQVMLHCNNGHMHKTVRMLTMWQNNKTTIAKWDLKVQSTIFCCYVFDVGRGKNRERDDSCKTRLVLQSIKDKCSLWCILLAILHDSAEFCWIHNMFLSCCRVPWQPEHSTKAKRSWRYQSPIMESSNTKNVILSRAHAHS